MTIDEAIAQELTIARNRRKNFDECNERKNNYSCRICVETQTCLDCAEEHEQFAEWLQELKAIKEMDLYIPQHFTKEQSAWIKAYCIHRNKQCYNKAIDDFVRFASTMPTVEEKEYIRGMSLEEMAEQLKAGGENE